ncbi:AMP-binding protein [Nocardia pseudovaccinii]|uniref:AMP-binding protein n=1 Tax=Nocardia pseudovaccinii TaxID=189540 RepID=UPI0007A3C548|nr:AMP-binding protein [Nocardia pseudovaccinii]
MTDQTAASLRLPVLEYLAAYGDRPCFFFEGATISYREVLESIHRIARALLTCGIGPGDGVAILSGNRPELFYVRTAAQLIGVRTTSLHTLGSVHDHAFILRDAELDGIVFDPRYEDIVVTLGTEVPLRTVASLGPAGIGFDLIGAASAEAPQPPETGPVQVPRALVYTGGTTGRPKGIIMSPTAQAFAAAAMLEHWQWPDEVRILLSTPLNHAAGTVLPPTFARGGSVVLLPGFSPDTWLAAVEQHRATAALIVPTQLYRILDEPSLAHTDHTSLETIFYGAAPCSPTRLAEAIRIFGPVFFQFYGQSEAPMTMSVLRKEEHDLRAPRRLSSCGRPVPGIEVSLFGEDGNVVPRGEPGEICVRGPLVALESYKGRPAETAAALEGGWLHTGDVATEDEEGFLYVVDRKKDMIVSGGFNIYPREIEDCLGVHPAVGEVAVIGIPDERWGEAVKAVVVRRPDHDGVTENSLIDFVKDRLGSLHAPKSLDFVDTIPLSPLGKPDKKALRARHWGDRSRLVN